MEIYQDQDKSFTERAADLVSHMTIEEKISQLGNNSRSITRLGIPFYDYWSEASHGFLTLRNPDQIGKKKGISILPICRTDPGPDLNILPLQAARIGLLCACGGVLRER